jgi:hypothetical protein
MCYRFYHWNAVSSVKWKYYKVRACLLELEFLRLYSWLVGGRGLGSRRQRPAAGVNAREAERETGQLHTDARRSNWSPSITPLITGYTIIEYFYNWLTHTSSNKSKLLRRGASSLDSCSRQPRDLLSYTLPVIRMLNDNIAITVYPGKWHSIG